MGFLDDVHQDVPAEAFSEGKGTAQQQHCGLHPVDHIVPEVARRFSSRFCTPASIYMLSSAVKHFILVSACCSK